MCANNIKISLLLFLLFLPLRASAKISNFSNRSDFGVGVDGILEAQPNTDFTTSPRGYASKYSHAFGLQPFGDFGNFVVKADFSLHYAPNSTGGGTDSRGVYSDSSSASIWSIGAILELIPYVAKDHRERIFIRFGGGEAKATITNTRNYAATTNIEKDNGNAEYYIAGAGYEFFLLQNYSLELGTGYQYLDFKQFNYSSGLQVNGSALTSGAAVTNINGTNKTLDLSGLYFNIALNLHF